MATMLTLPPGAEEKYQKFRGKIAELLGNIFDPNKNSVPKELPGMTPPPTSLTEHMTNMLLDPTYKEFITNSILGIAGSGAMPMKTYIDNPYLFRGVSKITEGSNGYWTDNLGRAKAYAEMATGKPGQIRVILKSDVPMDLTGGKSVDDAMAELGRAAGTNPMMIFPEGNEPKIRYEIPSNEDILKIISEKIAKGK
jgi:hypothetical protein